MEQGHDIINEIHILLISWSPKERAIARALLEKIRHSRQYIGTLPSDVDAFQKELLEMKTSVDEMLTPAA